MRASELHANAWANLTSHGGRLAHAILLSGQAGFLIAELAKEFAAALLCEKPAGSHACGTCVACNWYSQGNHPDFRYLRPEAAQESDDEGRSQESAKGKPSQEITIDQVRELADFLNIGAHRSGRRVVLIAPAEAMNRNTTNALLKSLEEPGPDTVFLLVTDDSDALLPTLRSRCLTVAVSAPQNDVALQWMHQQGVADAEHWLKRAGGAPKLGRELADGAQGRLLRLLELHLARGRAFDAGAAAAELDKFLRTESLLGMAPIVEWTQRWVLDGVLTTSGLPPKYFHDQVAALHACFDRTERCYLFKINEKIIEFKKLSKHTLNVRMFLESFFETYSILVTTGRA